MTESLFESIFKTHARIFPRIRCPSARQLISPTCPLSHSIRPSVFSFLLILFHSNLKTEREREKKEQTRRCCQVQISHHSSTSANQQRSAKRSQSSSSSSSCGTCLLNLPAAAGDERQKGIGRTNQPTKIREIWIYFSRCDCCAGISSTRDDGDKGEAKIRSFFIH